MSKIKTYKTCVRCCGPGELAFNVKRYDSTEKQWTRKIQSYEFWSCSDCAEQGLGPMKNSFGVGMLPILPLPLKLFWKEFRWT